MTIYPAPSSISLWVKDSFKTLWHSLFILYIHSIPSLLPSNQLTKSRDFRWIFYVRSSAFLIDSSHWSAYWASQLPKPGTVWDDPIVMSHPSTPCHHPPPSPPLRSPSLVLWCSVLCRVLQAVPVQCGLQIKKTGYELSSTRVYSFGSFSLYSLRLLTIVKEEGVRF
jgi:hypothetical protein